MSSVTRNISFHLLMQDERAKKAVEENNEKEFKKVLFDWGIDIDDHYTIESCEHRPLPDKPMLFNGPIVLASERLDENWLKSGHASWEAKVESIQDVALRTDLLEMGRTGCADRTFTNEDVARSVVKNERKKGV